MDDNKKTDSDKKPILRFGLLIEKRFVNNQEQTRITSNNQGIPAPEVVLIVEAWLEKLKESLKQPIKDNFTFFPPPSKDDDDKDDK